MSLWDLGSFPGEVVVWQNKANKHRAAKLFAQAACAPPSDPQSHPFRRALVGFTDGSAVKRADDPSGKRRWTSSAIVWRWSADDDWSQRGWPTPQIDKSTNSELNSVVCLLRQALETKELGLFRRPTTSDGGITTAKDRLVGFTDCQSVLDAIRDLRSGNRVPKGLNAKLLRELFALAAELRARGVFVQLRWVPSHRGVYANELVDRVAAAHQPCVIDPVSFPPAPETRVGMKKCAGEGGVSDSGRDYLE